MNFFISNNSLLAIKKSSLDWRLIGPAYWPRYNTSIQQTITSRTVNNTLITPSGTYPGSGAFNGGVLLPDGRVFCVPHNSTTARIYDPITNTLTTPSGTYPGTGAFAGGVLLPDGRVFCVPGMTTASRIYGGGGGFDINVSLSAYYNKL